MRWSCWLGVLILLVVITLPGSVTSVWASMNSAVTLTDNRCVVSLSTTSDEREIIQVIVSGEPPKGVGVAAASVPDIHIQGVIDSLSEVPAFDWSYGCSATSAAMLFGYYDRAGYSNMYTGSANGGVCPLNSSVWGHTWYPGVTCGECPLSATHLGVDGRSSRGHVDDYWIDYLNRGPDPYIVNHWTQHASDCTADFMGTSRSSSGLPDGATAFYWYSSGDPLYDYAGSGVPDGCHGMRLFAESRGYDVTANFSQLIKGRGTDPNRGFTFADFMAEIDAGRPVLIQLRGHTMLGYGYNTTGNTIYIHDTWDYSDHQMTWGGSYGGMQQQAVTVFRLAEGGSLPPSPTIVVSAPNGGERWQAGTYQTITWSYTGNLGPYVKIELLKGGDHGQEITAITSSASIGSGGSGSYRWAIPPTQTEGDDYQVRITSTSNSAVSDSSYASFSIIPPPPAGLAVTSPNGGQIWRVGTYQTITWTYSGNPGAYVKIELLKGGVVNRVITSSRSIGGDGSGSYRWLISYFQAAGSDYQVRITSTSNSAVNDTSDENFSIRR